MIKMIMLKMKLKRCQYNNNYKNQKELMVNGFQKAEYNDSHSEKD